MRVSVVIPTFNSGPLVVEAVRSVLAQTRPADEVIVVDDGSTDDTPGRLAGFGPPVRCVRQPNGGVSAARNRGVAEAAGDLIGFLDADDVWHPRKLEVQLPALAARPHLGLLATASYDWPADAHPPIGAAAGEPVGYPLDRLVTHNPVITSTVLVRAEVIRAAGEFDASLQGPEDYDLWLRVAHRAAVAVLPARLTGYRAATPNSLSKNAVRMEAGLRAILGKLEAGGVFRGQPVLRRKAWGYFRYNCGLMYRDAGWLGTALNRFARSLAAWPFRVNPDPAGGSLTRLKMLGATARAVLRGAAARPPGRQA
jgi:glycosyltransferase involved in cell wall biosynthesis